MGSHLVEHLLQVGCRVIVVDDLSSGDAANLRHLRDDAQLIESDVRDPSTFEHLDGIERVFHLAANASVPRSSERPLMDAELNVLGTINVLEFARRTGAAVTLASSAAVYGNPAYVPTDEAHPTLPVSPYGQSKLAAEGYARLYRHLWGVATQVLRYFNVYGERQRRFALWDLSCRVHNSEPELTVLGTGQQVRSFLHAADAARATWLVAESGVGGPVNVGGETVLALRDLAPLVAEVFQRPKPVRFSGESWTGDIAQMIPDTKLLRSMGFREQVPLHEGIARFAAWFRSAGGVPV